MSKGTILVVEPDEDIRQMIGIYFTGKSYEVYTFISPDRAQESILRLAPDVLLIGISEADKSGYELVHFLRTNEATKYIPFLFLYTPDESYRPYGEPEIPNIDDYLRVPFNIEELSLIVEKLLQRAKP